MYIKSSFINYFNFILIFFKNCTILLYQIKSAPLSIIFLEDSTSFGYIKDSIYNVSIKCSICKASFGLITMQNSSTFINNLTAINSQICTDFWFANVTQSKLNFSNGIFMYNEIYLFKNFFFSQKYHNIELDNRK